MGQKQNRVDVGRLNPPPQLDRDGVERESPPSLVLEATAEAALATMA